MCLWSKHVDNRPGDRMSLCGARMKPLGLTLKDREFNLFTGRESGEPAVVHECTKCGKVNLNRIAGDDNPYEIMGLLSEFSVAYKKVVLLSREEIRLVEQALFGVATLSSNYDR